jgi:hypothetical protein
MQTIDIISLQDDITVCEMVDIGDRMCCCRDTGISIDDGLVEVIVAPLWNVSRSAGCWLCWLCWFCFGPVTLENYVNR